MRDRIVLTREEQDKLCDYVLSVFKDNENLIFKENISIPSFDLEIVDKEKNETLNISRIDFEEVNNQVILSLSSVNLYDLELSFVEEDNKYKVNVLKEKWYDRKPLQKEMLIYNLGLQAYIINMFVILYNPRDVLELEEKACKKSQWNELKKQAPRENDGVRLFRCYTLKKDWQKAKKKKPHIITCEAWNVRGYYKVINGKRIFVKPYVKGKRRNDKEYIENALGKNYHLFPKGKDEEE